MRLRKIFCSLAVVLLSVPGQPAWACSVCSGDAQSPMAKGAVAGVIVMVGVIGFVLLGIAGTTCVFFVRGRRLQSPSDTGDAS